MNPANFPQRKAAKRESAKKRAEVAAKRTPADQLKHLDAKGFHAEKERAKLAKKMEQK